MKPKKNLTEWSIRIIVKNPFTSTTVSTVGFSDISPQKFQEELSRLIESAELPIEKIDDWKFWTGQIEGLKHDGWGKRRIFNYITKYIEMSFDERFKLMRLIEAIFGEVKGQLKLKQG